VNVLNRARRPRAETAAALAGHLNAFAAALAEDERLLLATALEMTMDPLDRMAARTPSDLLSLGELGVLADLLATVKEAER
jgi:hypothetical protein